MHIHLEYDPDGAMIITAFLLVAILILGLFVWGLISVCEAVEAWLIENHPDIAVKWGILPNQLESETEQINRQFIDKVATLV